MKPRCTTPTARYTTRCSGGWKSSLAIWNRWEIHLFNQTVNDGVAHSKNPRKCAYHVIDLWPWPWPWAHPGCTLTCSPSCESLVAIRPFVCEKKRFAQKFTDRRTDDGRLAIAKVKGLKVCIAGSRSLTATRDVTCHMGSHSVTCHPTHVNAPHLNPASKPVLD